MPARHLTPAQIADLDAIRAAAAAAHWATVEAGGPDPDVDILGAIAWRSGPPEVAPFDAGLRDLIERARRQRATWPEIAAACGDTPDEAGAARVQSRQRRRKARGVRRHGGGDTAPRPPGS